MALQKQLLPFNFTQGVKDKTDDFLSDSPAIVSDGQFVTKTAVQTRPGVVPALTGAGVTLGLGKRATKIGLQTIVETQGVVASPDMTSGLWRQIPADALNQLSAVYQHPSFDRASVEAFQIQYGGDHVLEYDMAGDSTTQVIAYLAGSLTSVATPIANTTSIWVKIIKSGAVVAIKQLSGIAGGSYRVLCPRVVRVSANQYYVAYLATDVTGVNCNINAFSVVPSTLTISGAGSGSFNSVANDVSLHGGTVDFNFDMCLSPWSAGSLLGTPDLIVAYMNTAQKLRISRINGTTGAITSTALTSVATVHDWTSIRVMPQTLVANGRSGYIAVCHTATSADGLVPYIADIDPGGGASLVAGTAVDATIGHVANWNIPGNVTDTLGGNFLFWDSDGTTPASVVGTETNTIKSCTLQFTTFVGARGLGAIVTQRGCGVGGDPFLLTQGAVRSLYLPVICYSETQPHYNVLNVAGVPSGNITPAISAIGSGALAVSWADDNAARIDMNGTYVYNKTYSVGGASVVPRWRMCQQPARPVVLSSTQFQFLTTRGGGSRLLERGVDVTPMGLDVITLDFGAQLGAVEIGNAGVLAGGCPMLFDGNSITELGFDRYPEYLISSQVGGGALAGVLADGTYGLSAVYEWFDAAGELHRSAPSPIQNFTVAGGAGVATILVKVPTLRITQKNNVRIALYATQQNQTVLQRALVTDITGAFALPSVLNDPTVENVSLYLHDVTNLSASDILYTTGGVLPNGAYPACKTVTRHQNRVFFGGLLAKDTIQYTQEHAGDDGLFPGTNAVLSLSVDQTGGRVSNLQSMDDKLIALQEKVIGGFIGVGPNSLGLNNQLSDYVLFVKGYGHSWAQSNAAVRDPDGIWFLDSRGLRHLNRGLTLDMEPSEDRPNGTPMGGGVDNQLVNSIVQGSAHFQSNHQIVWALPAVQSLLVYDTEHKQWSTWGPNQGTAGAGPVDPIVISDTLAYLDTLGNAPGNSSLFWFPSTQKVDDDGVGDTSPVTLTLLTPWIKLAGVQGFQRACRLLVLALFPSAGSFPVTVEEFVNYVSSSVADSATTNFGAVNAVDAVTVEHQLARQKCDAVQFLVAVSSSLGPVRLINASIEIGVKAGRYKTARANRF